MKTELSAEARTAADQLKTDWPKLSDIGRARAIAAIKKAGMPLRELARQTGRSEPLLRHILLGLEAPLPDQFLAHQGKIPTNELVRRAKAAVARRSAKRSETLQRERKKRADKGAQLICDWLQDNQIGGAYAEQIIEEARRMMITSYYAGTLPSVTSPDHPDSPSALIELVKPKEPLDDAIIPAGYYSLWLYRWLLAVFSDPDLRDKAVDLALSRVQMW